MAWKGVCPVGERLHLVQLVSQDVAVSDAARLLGVSRRTAHKWLRRAEEEGTERGLENRSRARHSQQRFEGPAVGLLLELRRAHPRWGPEKLLRILEREHSGLELPAVSTAGDILKRAGLVTKRRRRNHEHAVPHLVTGLAPPTLPNDRWTADFKGQFRMQNGQLCYPLTLRDAVSRMLLDVRGFSSTRSDFVIPAFRRAFIEFGMPTEVHSDTGTPFGSTGLARLSPVSVYLLKLGIRPVYSRPAKPQDNGGHERMHRDLKDETTHPPGVDSETQQTMFDGFRHEFNEVRPHQALNGGTPSSRYTRSERRYPGEPSSPTYPKHWERRVVDAAGDMHWHDKRWNVTKALANESIGLEPIDDGVWRVYFAAMLIGQFNERSEVHTIVGLNRSSAQRRGT